MKHITDTRRKDGSSTSERLPGSSIESLGPRTAARWVYEHPSVIVMALAVASGLWALAASQQVFRYLSDDHDEGLYLLQADALAHGHLFPPAPRHPDAFLPWLSVLSDGRYILKYSPVHASILALGIRVLGSPRWSLALIAAGVVVMTYALAREVLGSRRQAALASAFLALSPLFLIQSATFLPYCSSLLLLEAFAFTLLSGVRRNSRVLLGSSGFLFGVALFARPFDALLFGAPLGLYFVVSQRHAWARLARNAGYFAVGAVLPLAAMLAYYRAATGSPFRPAFNLLEPADTVGFGPRKLLPSHPALRFTPELGWQGVGRHILLTSFWGFGGLLLIGLFLAGLLRRRIRGLEAWIALSAVTYSCGYAFFWGTYGTSLKGGLTGFLGPFYFLPVLVCVTLLAAKGFRALWRRDWVIAVLAVVGMVAVSGYLLAAALRVNLRLTEEDHRIYAPVAAAKLDRAVVFLPPMWGPHLLHPFAWLQNDADYGGTRVYALDRGEEANLALLDDFPDRTAYRLRLHGHYRADPPDSVLTSFLEPLTVVQQPSLDATLSLEDPPDEQDVRVSVTVNGRRDTFLLDTSSETGKGYVASIRIRADAVELDGPFETHLTEFVSADESIRIAISTDAGDVSPVRTVYERQLAAMVNGPTLRMLLPGVVSVNELGGDPLAVSGQ